MSKDMNQMGAPKYNRSKRNRGYEASQRRWGLLNEATHCLFTEPEPPPRIIYAVDACDTKRSFIETETFTLGVQDCGNSIPNDFYKVTRIEWPGAGDGKVVLRRRERPL